MITPINEGKCIGCGTCVEVCTKDVFRFDYDKGVSTIVYYMDCQTCYNCELHCPAEAIHVNPMHKRKVMPW